MTVIETLSAYSAAEQTRRLPEEVWHQAKRAVIDWFAALLPGMGLPPATLLVAGLADELTGQGAAIYGTGHRGPIRTAALINATASHTVEFDDIFRDAIYHPGCPTIGAALAGAQARGADGVALLRAVIIGYEISTRIGVAVQPSHYKYWHTTGTIGTFGAAAAIAALLGLDAVKSGHALATAATFAAGLQKAYGSDSMSKPLHAGHAAEAGALAALGAGAGIKGALDVLDGPGGFGAAMSAAADWSKATEELGTRYNIARMTVKNHGCCGHSFAAIDAALAIAQAEQLVADDILAVDVGTYQVALDVTDRHVVGSPYEGKFSTPFTVASALVHGSVRLNSFSEERLADRGVRDLMARVNMRVEAQCDAAFPTRRSAVVAITTHDGRRFSHYQPTRKGDPDAPLTDDDLSAKFRELAGPVLGTARAEALLASLWRLERLGAAEIARLGVV